MPAMLFLLFIICCISHSINSEAPFKGMYWKHSIKGPYSDLGANGEKQISNWQIGGHVQIKNNFIRLTPDQPSRSGYLYNQPIGPEGDFSVLLRFRISGQAERLSGEGLALWFTSDGKNFATGMVMGHTDTITGFGVLFDTFVTGDEDYRSVVVVASDGKEAIYQNDDISKFPGCKTAAYRRWEGKDSFSVEEETVVKISFLRSSRIIVEIDPLSKGEFEQCVDTNIAKYLPKRETSRSWRDSAHFSLSASTGVLHDNHDILEMIVTEAENFDKIMEVHDEVSDQPPVQIIMGQNLTAIEVGDHVNVLAYEVKDVDERLQKLQHEMEHAQEKVIHRLEKLIKELQAQESRLEGRVLDMEKRTSSEVFKQVEQRLTQLEASIYKNVNTNAVYLAKEVNSAKEQGSSWRYPFFIFAFFVIVVFIYLTFTVFKINKNLKKDPLRTF